MTVHAPLFIDIAGTELTPIDRQRLNHPLVGGLILFARNWDCRAQLSALCSDIKRLRPDLLIAVDHEGGRVQRFRSDGFTHLPPMRWLGQQWQHDPMAAQAAAHACGLVLAAELRACGVDLSFTPVLDLDWPQDETVVAEEDACASRSSVIGDRALHASAQVVTPLARTLVHGLLQAGMAHCGKHFPGHGHALADSHTAVPVDERSLEAILADDAAPYRWLGSALSAVMPAHVVYPQVDTRPAGFSRRWLQDVLRTKLGFEGAIISDDLSMAGARQVEGKVLDAGAVVLAALQAGCDMALLCNQSLDQATVIDEVLAELSQALKTGRWLPESASPKRRQALMPRFAAPDWDCLMADARYQRARRQLP